jgi:hypothetical protein
MSDYNDLCAAARKPIPPNTRLMKRATLKPLKITGRQITQADIDRTLEDLRERRAKENLGL